MGESKESKIKGEEIVSSYLLLCVFSAIIGYINHYASPQQN